MKDDGVKGGKRLLRWADLHGAILVGARLEGAYLRWSNVEDSHLAGAKLDDDTLMPEGWEDIVPSRPEDHGPVDATND